MTDDRKEYSYEDLVALNAEISRLTEEHYNLLRQVRSCERALLALKNAREIVRVLVPTRR